MMASRLFRSLRAGLAVFALSLVALWGARSGPAAAQSSTTLTIVNETDPGGGTDFPFLVFPNPYQFDLMWDVSDEVLGGIFDIAVDSQGYVYASEGWFSWKVRKLDGDGNFISFVAPDHISNPGALAVDDQDNLYVANNNHILVINSDGDFIRQFGAGTVGGLGGEFNLISGIAVDGEGNVFVSEANGNRVQKFAPNGDFLMAWGKDVVAGGATGFEVCTVAANCKNGEVGSEDGEFYQVNGVAVDDDGHVFVTEGYNHRVQKFTSDGGYLDGWGMEGNIWDGEFRYPYDIDVDASGYVYVVDSINNQIQVFDIYGVFIDKWGVYGDGEGQFNRPYGIAVNDNGAVYITDVDNERIQKFVSTAALLDDGQSYTLDIPGNVLYSIATAAPGDWMLTGIDCGGAPVSRAGDKANVWVTTGAHVTCTLTSGLPASLTITKESDPAGGEGFPFSMLPSSFIFAEQWGNVGIGNDRLGNIFDLSVDSDNNIFATDGGAISKYASDGTFLLSWGKDVIAGNAETGYEICMPTDTCQDGEDGTGNGEFTLLFGITTDADDNVYTADYYNGHLQKFDSNGNHLAMLSTHAGIIRDVAVDNDGNIYLIGPYRVTKIDSNGNFLLAWGKDVVLLNDEVGFEICTPDTEYCVSGKAGSGNGELGFGRSIAVDAEDNVYVLDSTNSRVQKYDSNGTPLFNWGSGGGDIGQFDRPKTVETDVAGNIYVADDFNHRVQIFDSDGNYLDQVGHYGEGREEGQFARPRAASVSNDGNLYVFDGESLFETFGAYHQNYRVQRFVYTGATLDHGDSHTVPGLTPGAYAITEAVPDGWQLDEVDCGAAPVTRDGDTVSVTLGSAADVVCTFSNDRLATLVLNKVTNPAGGAGFPFVVTPEGGAPGDEITLDDGGSQAVANLAPGDYDITELVPDGWVLDAADCGAAPATRDGDTVSVTLEPGDTVTCTFTNNQLATLTIAKSTNPAGGAGFPFTLTPSPLDYAGQWGGNGGDSGQFRNPVGVATDADGNVYVTDGDNHRVQKFDRHGNFLLAWGKDVLAGGGDGHEVCATAASCQAGVQGSGDGEFAFPLDVAVDGDGNVYVADTQNHRIQKFDGEGDFIIAWGSSGVDDGRFNLPAGVAADGDGNVYVVDMMNHRVQKFSDGGDHIATWGGPTAGSATGQFNTPNGVAVDGDGFVYVADSVNHRVQKFNGAGDYQIQWGGLGQTDGKFAFPIGLGVDGEGAIYVADFGNQRVQKFSSAGDHLLTLADDGQVAQPNDVAAGDGGLLYVTDSVNHRVQIISPDGATLDDGGSHAFTGLLPGVYQVTELVPDGWLLDGIDCGAATATRDGDAVSVTLGAGGDVVCVFANSDSTPPATGAIRVTKEIEGGGTGTFTICVDGDCKSYAAGDGEAQTWSDLAPGNYTVSEIDAGPEWDEPADQVVTVTAGQTAEVTVTNVYNPPPTTTALFFSANTHGITSNNVAFGSEDILKWDGSAWSMWFDGSVVLQSPRKPKHNINAFWIPDPDGQEVIMSFAQNGLEVPGVTPLVDGMDLVRWDGSTFSLWLDGSDVGLTEGATEIIDGLHVLDGDESPIGTDCVAYLLISTHGAGQVPNYNGGQLTFGGEDVLGFCATSLGATTSGLWHMVLDGSTHGLRGNMTDSISASADGRTLYLTTKAVFKFDGVKGDPGVVYAYNFDTGEFSGPLFAPADEGLPAKTDGLHMN